jgi:hypothetical protein
MLRNGRLPSRSFERLLARDQQQLSGFLIGYEVKQQDSSSSSGQEQPGPPLTAQQEAAVEQLLVVLGKVLPGHLPGAWYGSWAADAAGASCRIMPAAGPSAAAAAAAEAEAAATAASQQQRPAGVQQPMCSLGQQFLQTYLDSLGALNTFG